MANKPPRNNFHLSSPILAQFTPSNPTPLTMTGGPYGSNVYQLASFHFHWGCNNGEGSEHTINGKRYECHPLPFKQYSPIAEYFILLA